MTFLLVRDADGKVLADFAVWDEALEQIEKEQPRLARPLRRFTFRSTKDRSSASRGRRRFAR